MSVNIKSEKIALFDCEECEQKFTQKASLKKHIDSIHKKTKHSCDICDQTFTSEHHMKEHRNILHFENLQCSKCTLFQIRKFCAKMRNISLPRKLEIVSNNIVQSILRV